jgi:hypothetical protein
MNFESEFFSLLQKPGFDFEAMALGLFRFQAKEVRIYREFLELMKVDAAKVNTINEIPFLPISFFKTQEVLREGSSKDFYFKSSTTSGGTASIHFVPDTAIYEWSFMQSFKKFIGDPKDYCILALLPNYIEQGNSSLVYMTDHLVKASAYPQSGFFLHDHALLYEKIEANEAQKIPTILLGVTYALLDFAEEYPMRLEHTIIVETGGMKGRREELLRAEVHEILKGAFQIKIIHSEYGMTELLSQAWSHGGGVFHAPAWMRVLCAELSDPKRILPAWKSGSINIIDLANIYSCAFIATDDLGIVNADGSFEVIGRKDYSDIRGCNLMYSQ